MKSESAIIFKLLQKQDSTTQSIQESNTGSRAQNTFFDQLPEQRCSAFIYANKRVFYSCVD
jgi:hypothetical protein